MAYDDARDLEKQMYVFMGVGAVAVATGVALYILGDQRDETDMSVAPTTVDGGGGVTVFGRF